MNEKPRQGRPLFGPDGPSPREWFIAGVALGAGFMLVVFIGAGLAALVRWLAG